MTIKLPFSLLGAVASQAEAEAGSANNKVMTPQRVKQAVRGFLGFSGYYESAEQTITLAAQLVLAHGLSAKPVLFSTVLVCKATQGNYAVGDEVPVPHFTTFDGTTSSNMMQLVPDATNITVRYASSAGVFTILDKNTGSRFTITPANWRLIVRAWA